MYKLHMAIPETDPAAASIVNEAFNVGDTVQSIHTGCRLQVTGPGLSRGTFSGREIGKPDRFCVAWRTWNVSSFKKVGAA